MYCDQQTRTTMEAGIDDPFPVSINFDYVIN